MEAVFLQLLNRSIAAGWLVLAVILMRLVLKKAPKSFRCVLWALVGIRLICPFSFESVLSLIPSAETVPREIVFSPAPAIDSGMEIIDSVVNTTVMESLTPEPAASANPVQIWLAAGTGIWLVGAAAMLGYALFSCIRIRRKVAPSVNLGDGVYLCDYISSPFILGIFRPKIYLPSTLPSSEAGYVLAHERAHLCRRDHWWKPLGFVLLAVYWFNPLMWAAYILLCRDIELACDERVVRDMDAPGKKAYSEALLTCSLPKYMIAACPLAFGEVGVKERVKSVLNYKKPTFWVLIAAVAACAVLAVCFLTNPKSQVAPEVDGTLCYPGLRWNMTSQQVTEALGLSEGDYTVSKNEVENSLVLTVNKIKSFGMETEGAAFRFEALPSQQPGLSQIWISYPENTDMNTVLSEVENTYGAPFNADAAMDKGNPSQGHIVSWISADTLESRLSGAQQDIYTIGKRAMLPESLTENLEHPLSALYWTDDAAWLFGSSNAPMEDYSGSRNYLIYDGTYYAYTLQLQAQNVGRTTSAESTMDPNRRLRISAVTDVNAEYTEIAGGTLSGFLNESISCCGLTDVTIDIGGETMPLEDALKDGRITAEEIIAYAQLDAENGICRETADSKLGLSCFLYSYPEFELEVINDIYETPDGNQYLIKQLSLYRLGGSQNTKRYYIDDESEYGYAIDREDWGVTLEVAEVSPTGITLTCTQSGGQQLGQLETESYLIMRASDSSLYSGGFDMQTTIQKDGTTQIAIDWTDQHGELPSGDYLLKLYLEDIYDETQVHPLMRNFTDVQSYCVEFSIP